MLNEFIDDMEINTTFYIARYSSNDTFIRRKTVKPSYKSLKKTYKKESNQMFFREALDGKFTLFGEDYDLINAGSLEDKFKLSVTRAGIENYLTAHFNKTDCKFNHSKRSVEIKLTCDDKYADVLAKYENTYDLLKDVNPAITRLSMTKRSIVQIYIQGESTISSYSGGTYWETDVNEVIDNEDALKNKYYFAKGPTFTEIYFEDSQDSKICPSIMLQNGVTYSATSEEGVWAPAPVPEGITAYIKFLKVASKGDTTSKEGGYLLSSGETGIIAKYDGSNTWTYLYDMYQIQFWSNYNTGGSTMLVAQSVNNYAKDSNDFIISAGEGLYEIKQNIDGYDNFNLGEYAINYNVWGRIICDADSAKDKDLYDLPYDDFATERANYKKCIGLTFSNSSNSVCRIYQSTRNTTTPNSYGLNDSGTYFLPPYNIYNQVYYPVARSSWANTSIWIQFIDAGDGVVYDFETWMKDFNKPYTLRNAYHIADVISALLSKIAPDVKHEATGEYSKFLYGQTDGLTRGSLGGCQIYITPKSNILKGEYDQAAQKAEITLKQIMEMLRDCYRCYWYIDSDNRLIIEHVSFFMNGLSYSTPSVQAYLDSTNDKFTGVNCLYGQREIEYEKSELYSRYEFAWSDDSTDAMGNLYVDISDKYIQENKQDINIEVFSSDVDYMLFMPSDFSNDGFALLMAKDKKVPLIRTYIKYDKYYDATMLVTVQNWYASWNNLINHYMYDMPGYNISCSNIQNTPRVIGIKRFMSHDISVVTNKEFDIYKLIRTNEGDGYIDEMSVDINTGLCDITLMYKPK